MKPFVSFVIPAYNEEKNAEPLFLEIKQVASDLIKKGKISNLEVIFIDDGSTDKTYEVLSELEKTEQKVKVVGFKRNFGKAETYKAGFDIARGDLIFTMDADLQDNPQDIPAFIEKIEQGYDLVIGWKYFRKDTLISKKIPSKIFNFILRSFTKLPLHDFDCGYRCMKKEIIPHLDLYEGLYRYIPVHAHSKGFKITEIKVNHRKRRFGKSKYGFSRFIKGFFDLITTGFLFFYLKRPLHFFGGIGSLFLILGFLLGIYLTYIKIILKQLIGNRPLLLLSVLLIIVGVQLILFGLIGEMITYTSRKEKNYLIKK